MSRIKQKEDVTFKTECGQAWKLVFEKREYKAYVFVLGGWKPMFLGSCNPYNLMEYIQREYRKEVKEQ